jgi:hypothetical protein
MATPLDDDYHKAYTFNESSHGHDAHGGIDESPEYDQGRRYFQSVFRPPPRNASLIISNYAVSQTSTRFSVDSVKDMPRCTSFYALSLLKTDFETGLL